MCKNLIYWALKPFNSIVSYINVIELTQYEIGCKLEFEKSGSNVNYN